MTTCVECGTEVSGKLVRGMHKRCYNRLHARGEHTRHAASGRYRTPEQINWAMAEFARLVETGPNLTQKECAQKIGADVGTVRAWFRRAGLPMPLPRGATRRTYDTIAEDYWMLLSGGFEGTMAQAAAALGVHERRLYRALKRCPYDW